MFSNACEYGLKAMVFIAKQSKEGKLSNVGEIAAAINSPKAFTAKVLQQLVKKSVVLSSKGAQGGFYISEKKLDSLTLFHVVQAIDGNGIAASCILGLHHCSDTNPCPVHNKYKPIRTKLVEMLQTSLVSNLADDLIKKIFVLKT